MAAQYMPYAKTTCQNNRRGRRILALWGSGPLLRGGACPSSRAAPSFLAHLNRPLPLALPAQVYSDSVPVQVIWSVCVLKQMQLLWTSLTKANHVSQLTGVTCMQACVCRLGLCKHQIQQEDRLGQWGTLIRGRRQASTAVPGKP